MKKHYIAILTRSDLGEWRAIIPDLPGCEAKGFSLEDAKFSAASALARCLEQRGGQIREPMDMAAIEHDGEWLAQHQIDLSKAIISVIPLAA